MARQRDNKPSNPGDSASNTWVGLKQLEHWKREAAPQAYATLGFKLLTSAGKVTRKEYVDSMFHMERLFPGLGWGLQANDLGNFYDLRQLELFKRPIIRTLGSDPFNPIREPGQEG